MEMHNKMERLRKNKFRMFEKNLLVVVLCSVFLFIASSFLLPSVSLAAEVVNFSFTTGGGGLSIAKSNNEADAGSAIVYVHPNGSGYYLIDSLKTRFVDNAGSSSMAVIRVRVTEGGSNPNALTGSIVSSGSLTTSIAGAGGAAGYDRTITLNNSFVLKEGHKYFFKFWYTEGSNAPLYNNCVGICSGLSLYVISSGNNGHQPYVASEFSFAWHELFNYKSSLTLYGAITPAPPDVDNQLVRLTNDYVKVGQNIDFRALWNLNGTNLGFVPYRAWVWPDISKVQQRNIVGNAVSGGLSNPQNFSLAYASGATYISSIVLGSQACIAANTGSISLRGVGCVYKRIDGSSFRVWTDDQLAERFSGSTVFNWNGGYQPYGLSGNILTPTGTYNTNDATTFEWLGANTGSLYWQQYESGGIITPSDLIGPLGVFNPAFLNFEGFGEGSTGNQYLDIFQLFFRQCVYAVVWVGSKLFGLLQYSAFYGFIIQTIHPLNGTVNHIPTELFGVANPVLPGTAYTIHYTTVGNAQNVTKLFQLMTALFAFMWVGRKFLLFKGR